MTNSSTDGDASGPGSASPPAGDSPGGKAATAGTSSEAGSSEALDGSGMAGTGIRSSEEAPRRESSQTFAYKERFPDARAAISLDLSPPDIEETSTLVFLDTSVLLSLYDASEEAARKALEVLGELRDEGRLVLPGHVAREFAVVRSYKIGDLYDDLSRQSSRLGLPDGPQELANRALLERAGYADRLRELREQIAELVESYQAVASELMTEIESWAGSDFISEAYAELFGEGAIEDPEFGYEDSMVNLQRRDELSRPPGYLDSDKSQNAAGDLLIWKTILKVAARRDQDAIFVTEDRKPDWWHQGGKGTALYPRTELLHEFDQETGGRSFGLLTLPDFLGKMGAGSGHVQRIRETVGGRPSTETIQITGHDARVKTVAEVAANAFGAEVVGGGRLGDKRSATLQVREEKAESLIRLARAAGIDVSRGGGTEVAKAFERYGERSEGEGPPESSQ